jgi:hypothetical protein
MQINFKALLIFIAFAALIAMATSSNGGTWFHVGEAVSTVVILAGVAGFLTGNRSRARRSSTSLTMRRPLLLRPTTNHQPPTT